MRGYRILIKKEILSMIKSTFAEEFCRVSGVSTERIASIELIYEDLNLNSLPLSFEQKYRLVRDAAYIAMASNYDSELANDCEDISD